MKLIFVDAAVLIAAARGGSEQAARAMEILDDPEREFAASAFLRLEVLPQAVFNKREAARRVPGPFVRGRPSNRAAAEPRARIQRVQGDVMAFVPAPAAAPWPRFG
jgi:hypothetical protein